MILGTKKLEDQAAFTEEERQQLYKNARDMIAEGVPGEIPAALPAGLLIRLIGTLKKYDELLARLASWDAGIETPDIDRIIECWDELRLEAKTLRDVKPPLAQPSRVLIPGSQS
jgi:hypothetical protein